MIQQKSVRHTWLDVAKGIGIILVVYGHIMINGALYTQIRDVVYAFHMPLFFAISGYTIMPGRIKDFTVKRAQNLLIPYAVYLFLIGAPLAMSTHNLHHRSALLEFLFYLYGGDHLVVFMTAFWFVTCLFFSIVLYKVMLTFFKSPLSYGMILSVIALYLLAYAVVAIAGKISIPVPLALDHVPMACVFIWFGSVYKHFEGRGRMWLVGGLVGLFGLLAIYRTLPFFTIDMKTNHYGPFVAGFIASIGLTVLCLLLSKLIAHYKAIAYPIELLGRASLTIMFVSQPILLMMKSWGVNFFLIWFVALIIPLGLHIIFGMNKYTALFLLGRRHAGVKPLVKESLVA